MTKKEVRQVLHCSHSTVADLVNAGLLRDRHVREDGATRYFGDYSKADVSRIAKVYRRRISVEALRDLLEANELHKVKENGKVKEKAKANEETIDSVIARIKNIEAMVSSLSKKWG